VINHFGCTCMVMIGAHFCFLFFVLPISFTWLRPAISRLRDCVSFPLPMAGDSVPLLVFQPSLIDHRFGVKDYNLSLLSPLVSHGRGRRFRAFVTALVFHCLWQAIPRRCWSFNHPLSITDLVSGITIVVQTRSWGIAQWV